MRKGILSCSLVILLLLLFPCFNRYLLHNFFTDLPRIVRNISHLFLKQSKPIIVLKERHRLYPANSQQTPLDIIRIQQGLQEHLHIRSQPVGDVQPLLLDILPESTQYLWILSLEVLPKREIPNQHPIDENSYRPEIGLESISLPRNRLWRQVPEIILGLRLHVEFLFLQLLKVQQIDEIEVPLRVYKQTLYLHILPQDLLAVEVLDDRDEAGCIVPHRVDRKFRLALEVVAQVIA